LEPALVKIADNPAEDAAVRIEALRALAARRPRPPPEAFDFLLLRLAGGSDPMARLAAAEVLRRSQLSGSEFLRALRAVRGDALISPTMLLPALRDGSEEAVADELIALLRAGWSPAEQELARVFELFPARAEAIRSLIKRPASVKLAEFEALLSGGNAERGRAVFYGVKVGCAACHRISDAGGTVGPDLTRIGAIRAGRDLLESLLVPSSTFAQGYESYAVQASDGRVFSGLIASQSADAVVLRDSGSGEVRIRRDQIKEMKRSAVSIMPEGLERGITREEFRDLLAFLQSLK
jgi:quinoprotein glucose dehydrogenase